MLHIDDITYDEKIILDFLTENPEMFSTRKKSQIDPLSSAGKLEIVRIIKNAKLRPVVPNNPTTVPDHAVSVILGAWYNIPEERWDQVKREHQYSMVAENLVGEFLERYIDYICRLNDIGWVRAWGDVVKSVDFIKKDVDGWRLLQIKNRDNSENSSSQRVRDGTTIEKWFRTFSKTGATNWENFPDPILSKIATEQDFHMFVAQSLMNNK